MGEIGTVKISKKKKGNKSLEKTQGYPAIKLLLVSQTFRGEGNGM